MRVEGETTILGTRLESEKSRSLSQELKTFKAGGTLIALPEFADNDRVMKVAAFVLDSIDAIGELDSYENPQPHSTVNSWMRLMARLDDGNRIHPRQFESFLPDHPSRSVE
jgi:hypothetical protein